MPADPYEHRRAAHIEQARADAALLAARARIVHEVLDAALAEPASVLDSTDPEQDRARERTPVKNIDWRIVGIALIPALGLSIGIVLLGASLGLSDTVADRVSQVVFFPVFLSAYLFTKRRRDATDARSR